MTATNNQLHSIACQALCLIVLLTCLCVVATSGCSDDSGTGPDEPKQDLNTPSYFEDAIVWNGSLHRWMVLNWMGTHPDGGPWIVLQVHDRPHEVPPDFDADAARKAIDYARDAWVGELRTAGISVHTITTYTSNSQVFIEPRIDVRYVSDINGGYVGLCTHHIDVTNREFYNCDVQIKTGLGAEGYRIVTTHELGHALGNGIDRVAGHSNNPNDVMYHASRYWRLTNGDRATIRRVYGTTPYYSAMGTKKATVAGPPEIVDFEQPFRLDAPVRVTETQRNRY